MASMSAAAAPGGWATGDGTAGAAQPLEEESLEDMYKFDVFPSELYFKFRKELQGLRVGVNVGFFNLHVNECEAKIVLKPLSNDRHWKFMYKPINGDVMLLSKKIPITRYLNLQVGLRHNFQMNAIGWNWKLSTCLGGDGVSQIKNKTKIAVCPGFDMRIGWRAEYVLPEVKGSVGSGEPAISLDYGRLHASVDRVEAILTHAD